MRRDVALACWDTVLASLEANGFTVVNQDLGLENGTGSIQVAFDPVAVPTDASSIADKMRPPIDGVAVTKFIEAHWRT